MGKFEGMGIGLSCGAFKSTDVAQNIFGAEHSIQAQMTVEAAL